MNYDNKLKSDWQEEHIEKLEHANEHANDKLVLIELILKAKYTDEDRIRLITKVIEENTK